MSDFRNANLISGEEALENYNEAQVRFSSKEDWVDLKVSVFTISDILREKHFNRGWNELVFRIKPKTITINGIEVPAPFEPKDGDGCWILAEGTRFKGGYRLIKLGSKDNNYIFGAWRTECEIKQVVEVLRSILKPRTQECNNV